MTLLEGLGEKEIPCSEVLSVAGFLGIMGLFPPGRAVILRVRKAPFLLREALLFNLSVKSVIPSTGRCTCGPIAAQCAPQGS